MTRSHPPGEQLAPGQSAAESAVAPAGVAGPVLPRASSSHHDSTDASCSRPQSREDGTSTGEPEDTATPSQTRDTVVPGPPVLGSRKLARRLLSSSPETHRSSDDDRYMPLATLSRYSGLSVRTLRAALRDPLHPLPHYRVNAGGKVLVRRSEFDAWMSHCRVDSTDVDAIVREVLGDVT